MTEPVMRLVVITSSTSDVDINQLLDTIVECHMFTCLKILALATTPFESLLLLKAAQRIVVDGQLYCSDIMLCSTTDWFSRSCP